MFGRRVRTPDENEVVPSRAEIDVHRYLVIFIFPARAMVDVHFMGLFG